MFKKWLAKARITDDSVGDLISDFKLVVKVGRRRVPDTFESLDALCRYLRIENACPEALKAAAGV